MHQCTTLTQTIRKMADHTQTTIVITQKIPDQLLQPQKQRRQVQWEEQCKEPILGINDPISWQPQRSQTGVSDLRMGPQRLRPLRPNEF